LIRGSPFACSFSNFHLSVSSPTGIFYQLTPYEKETLNPTPPVSSSEALYHFYLIWTLKEAYTKALGLGLGFDFKRIEYDKVKNRVKVDGVFLKGWTFDIFRVPDPEGGAEEYIGVAAKYVGGKEAVVRRSPASSDLFSLSIMTAEDFMSRALRELE
jgi:4'-phosphopantetheinyl transferase